MNENHIEEEDEIKVGDIYEDCGLHPVRCTFIDYDTDEIEGISMVDGSWPQACSLMNCGVIKISEEEAKLFIENKFKYGSQLESIHFLDTCKIDGAVWMESA